MIVIKELRKTFHRGSINEVTALSGINLKVRKNDFITLIGSNGAGKSTLLNCLAGSYPIDAGALHIDEEDVSSCPKLKFIGINLLFGL